jgi:hypothetical protein
MMGTLSLPSEAFVAVPAAALVFVLLRRRPLCWVLGHRVGPAVVARHEQGETVTTVRTSRCRRCGRTYSSAASAVARPPADVDPAA